MFQRIVHHLTDRPIDGCRLQRRPMGGVGWGGVGGGLCWVPGIGRGRVAGLRVDVALTLT